MSDGAGRGRAERAVSDRGVRSGLSGGDHDRPATRRRVVVALLLVVLEGLSYRDVAAALSEPEGTVKYRIRTGMQKMRAALQAVEVAP